MKYLLFAFTVLSFAISSFAGSIKYNLRMTKPENHYFQVEMELDGFKEKQLKVKMPVWAPGSYLVREFAKNINLVTAFDKSGNEIPVKKVDKNTWCIDKGKTKDIVVKYEVYSFEVSVRTPFLDLTHGFVSGTGVFMYVDGYKDQSGKLEVFLPEMFKTISTSLDETGDGVTKDGSTTFAYTNYDQLADCPIEIGNQEVFSFDAAGVKHTVAMYGVANYDIPTLQKDMAKIVEAATAVFGQNPNKKYTFIIHNEVNAQGGLEHVNSTVLSVNRWTYDGAAYKGFLSLVAHEYFHLWNVKRIRPVELGPFDYDNENYTSLLWVMEGFTSYYDELLLLRAGYYTKEELLKKLFSSINYVEGSTGARVQPVAHASFDAWIKAYRPTENSGNTTISYYPKGAAIAVVLDAMIIKEYEGKKSLDDFMQHLYATYYEGKGRGFSEDEFKKELESFLHQNMDLFYDNYINGTTMIDYPKYLGLVGLDVKYSGEAKASSGLLLKGDKQVEVYRIRAESSAEEAGLSVGDEIIGCNGFRVDKKALEDMLNNAEAGEVFEILFSRDELLYSTQIKIGLYEKPEFSYELPKEETELFKYWLRGL